MRVLNQCSISGRLGADAEGQVTPRGSEVCVFSMAYDNRRKNQAGEWETVNTTWLRVSVFDRRAHEIAAALSKGDFVTVHGAIHNRRFQKKDGSDGWQLEMIADRVDTAVPLPTNNSGGGFSGGSNTGWGQQQSQGGFGNQADPFQTPQADEEPPF